MLDTLSLALSALEESFDLVRNDYIDNWRHGVPSRERQLAGLKDIVDDHERAIVELRELISSLDTAQ